MWQFIMGQAVHHVTDASALVAGSWDVSAATTWACTRMPVAQRFLNDGGILCGATCWVRFGKKQAVGTIALKAEVLAAMCSAPTSSLAPTRNTSLTVPKRWELCQPS